MTKPGKGPGRGLTAKQQRFVEEYLADENMNATKAAIGRAIVQQCSGI